MKIKLSPFIVRKSVTGIESMDFRSAPVRFRFPAPHRGFFISATSVISASIFTKERKHPAGCLAFWMMTYFTGCNR